jgi:hypothetical protein
MAVAKAEFRRLQPRKAGQNLLKSSNLCNQRHKGHFLSSDFATAMRSTGIVLD